MPLPAIPDADFAAGAAVLREQLLGLDKSLDAKEFQAASTNGLITAAATGLGVISGLTIDPAVIASPPSGGLGPAVASTVNAALHQAEKKARGDLAALAAGMSLPGFPANPPLWPDVPSFRAAAFDFRCGVHRVESELEAKLTAANAADGKVEVKVSGLLEVAEIRLEASLFTSPDGGNVALFIQTAANQALRDARRDLACKAADTAAVFAAMEKPADVRPRALLVVLSTTLSASDEALRARLVSLGFNVEIRAGVSTSSTDADGKSLIVISESISSSDVGTKFTNSVVPIVVLESALFDDLKMTGATWHTDDGDDDGRNGGDDERKRDHEGRNGGDEGRNGGDEAHKGRRRGA
jgi:DNA-binding protein YbaB